MPDPFVPSWWLPGGHAQTVFEALCRPWPVPPVVRERWELPDGDFLDLDRLAGPDGAPLLLVLHGLEGSSRAPYVRGMLDQASRRGWRAAALNFRNCSDEPNRLLRSYHSGETGDLDHVARRLREEAGGPLLAVGFSLGGNVLCKWLGEQAEAARALIAAACAVSVPFDLRQCAANLDAPGLWRSVYRRRFLRSLKQKALRKARAFPGRIDEDRLRRAQTIGAFDEAVTAPVHSFASAEEYWAQSSSGPLLERVRVPLLLLSAEDDPIVPGDSLPAGVLGPAVRLHVVARGGHVGFVSGPPFAPRFWAEEQAALFLGSSGALRVG